MYYNESDLLEAVNNFKSLDTQYLLKQCDDWNISPCEVKENIDQMGFEKIDDINTLFYGLYNLRLNQLIQKVEELQKANIYTNCLDTRFVNELAKRFDETNDIERTFLERFQERDINYLDYFFNTTKH